MEMDKNISNVFDYNGDYYKEIGDFLRGNYLKYGYTQGTKQEVDFLVEIMEVPRNASILDIGCGPGRHCLELARRGYNTVGVDNMKYTCPCCGYKILEEEPPGSYEICSICFWEDDGTQYDEPDYDGGANIPSLKQAQKNFLEFGACEERSIEFVRKPNKFDIKDPNWKPLENAVEG